MSVMGMDGTRDPMGGGGTAAHQHHIHSATGPFKVLVIGATGVGKTWLVSQLCELDKIWNSSGLLSSSAPSAKFHRSGSGSGMDGHQHASCIVEVGYLCGHVIEFWEIPGSVSHGIVYETYARDANGIIAVFDLRNEDTLDRLARELLPWAMYHDERRHREKNPLNIPVLFVANDKTSPMSLDDEHASDSGSTSSPSRITSPSGGTPSPFLVNLSKRGRIALVRKVRNFFLWLQRTHFDPIPKAKINQMVHDYHCSGSSGILTWALVHSPSLADSGSPGQSPDPSFSDTQVTRDHSLGHTDEEAAQNFFESESWEVFRRFFGLVCNAGQGGRSVAGAGHWIPPDDKRISSPS